MDIARVTEMEDDILNRIKDPEYAATMQQIETSHNSISELIDECNEMVTNIRLANDLREINRRKEEESLERARTSFLEEESLKAHQQFDEINSKWDPISKYNDSIDIYNACETQREKCEELLKCKNNVIEKLKNDLTKADEKFSNDQTTQRNDINVLSYRIDKQIEILRDAYRKHLQLIENFVVAEQTRLIDECQAKWDVLNKKYEQEEIQDIEDRNKMVEEYEKQMDLMYSEHFEKYSETKENLEKELQDLQINVEEVKASCALDEKKLEYNYLVLTKRQKELVQIKSDQKQKINRLRDKEMKLRAKIEECEKNHEIQSKKLTKEITELEADFERNSDKMRRLGDVNEHTFKKIWQLNVKRAMTLVKKIVQIDRKIHEEVLQIEWKAPEFKLMHLNDLPSIQLALQNSKESDPHTESKQSSDKLILPEIPSADAQLTKFILQEIVKNVEFLNCQVNELTENLPQSQQSIVNYDYVLKALKIHDQARMELLKKRLIPLMECLTCKKAQKDKSISVKYQETLLKQGRTGSGHKTRQKCTSRRPSSAPLSSSVTKLFDNHLHKIVCRNPDHIRRIDQLSLINAISDFVVEVQKQDKEEKKCTSLDKLQVSRILTEADMQLYWEKFNSSIFKEKEFTWGVTQKCMQEYLDLVRVHSSLSKEVQGLEQQNGELKQLLSDFHTKKK
ncbi:dynein regulatory complex protein 1 [Planococcus citri]|uniref:dynein regulatory complex protein 1 n=1 Tax=Planococcus citri TaxID=170843 RepID=UPI0031F74D20